MRDPAGMETGLARVPGQPGGLGHSPELVPPGWKGVKQFSGQGAGSCELPSTSCHGSWRGWGGRTHREGHLRGVPTGGCGGREADP